MSYNIVLSGILFALTLIFQFLAKFMQFGSFLNFNFSLIFIIILYMSTNYKYALTILVLRFIIGPSFSSGYNLFSILGQFILLVSDLIYFSIFAILHLIFLRFTNLNIKKNIIISFSIATILNTILMAFLNGIFFTPAFFSILNTGPINFNFYVINWNNLNIKIFFFNAPTYWSGIFALYISFNMINFSITTIIISTLILLLTKFLDLNKISNFKKRKKEKILIHDIQSQKN